MAHALKKTAVIGLGGTGRDAVLYMKKRLLSLYGEVPPMIKFLVIDTTDQTPLETPQGPVSLAPGEFLRLDVKAPDSLIASTREVRDWFPDDVPRFALGSGAKQVRPLGRLAVFANAKDVDGKIAGLMDSVRNFRIGRSNGYETVSDSTVVNIVCSLSGGTGSGCFLDVAVLVRSGLSSSDRMIGYFLLPTSLSARPPPTTSSPTPTARS